MPSAKKKPCVASDGAESQLVAEDVEFSRPGLLRFVNKSATQRVPGVGEVGVASQLRRRTRAGNRSGPALASMYSAAPSFLFP
ncbi:MAG: hypothetical protein CMJ64_29480 [Planctomycetaceae bacterium]|nr:hypothetical protein [Planctomycetaceae bacterium]